MPDHSNPSSTHYIQSVHRKIQVLVTLGILGTAILVGLATTYPLYRLSANNFEEISQLNAASQAEAVRNQLLRYQDVTRQFASRTEIRRALDDYARGEITLEEVRAFSAPRLMDAMTHADNVTGMMRLAQNDEEVARFGVIARSLPTQGSGVGDGYPCAFLFTAEEDSLLLQSCSRIWEEDRLIGRDVVFFSAEPLLDLLSASAVQGYQPTIRLQEPGGERELVVRDGEYELQAAGKIGDDENLIHFYEPLDDQGWQLTISVPVQEYQQTIFQLLFWPLVAVLLMTAASIAAVRRTLSPLLVGVAGQAARLERSQQRLRQAAGVFRHAQESIAITDSQHRIIAANPAFSATTGYPEKDLRGRAMQDLLDLDADNALDLQAVNRALGRQDRWEGEVRYRTQFQHTITALQTISAVRNDAGEVVEYIHIFNDITDLKEDEEKVRHQALHDELTGLPNRVEFENRLEHSIRRASAGTHGPTTLMFLDLDHFKEANDTFGHQTGDRVLQLVAERLQGVLRAQDTLARIGGDEFVILLESGLSPADEETVAEKIVQTLRQPFHVDSSAIRIGVSVGISRFPQDASTATTLLRAADTAMYAAKAAGRNTWRHYAAIT